MGQIPHYDEYGADRLKAIELRLDLLERHNPLDNSSVRNGQITLQDANGVGIVVLGRQANGHHGIGLFDTNGQTLLYSTSEDGQTAPWGSIGVQPGGSALVSGTANSFRPGTNAATFTELWRADFYSTGQVVEFDFTVYPNAGNMDWQIKCYQANGTPTVVGSYTPTGGGSQSWPQNETANTQRSGSFVIPAAGLVSGTDPAGRRMTLRVEARKNSGATTIDVAVNAPFLNHN